MGATAKLESSTFVMDRKDNPSIRFGTPPSAYELVKFAKSPVGRILGSNTFNLFSGSLIGLGVGFLITGVGAPAGIPLIAVGLFLSVLQSTYITPGMTINGDELDKLLKTAVTAKKATDSKVADPA